VLSTGIEPKFCYFAVRHPVTVVADSAGCIPVLFCQSWLRFHPLLRATGAIMMWPTGAIRVVYPAEQVLFVMSDFRYIVRGKSHIYFVYPHL
jgi:hypothetical protein